MSSTGSCTYGLGDYAPRLPLDMEELDSEPSEMGWGYGIEPPSVRGRPPAEGGRYKGCEATLDHSPDPHVPVSRDLRI